MDCTRECLFVMDMSRKKIQHKTMGPYERHYRVDGVSTLTMTYHTDPKLKLAGFD